MWGLLPTPLYGTGRAAFPHPALCKVNCSSTVIDTHIYFRRCQRVLLLHSAKIFPRIASLFTPSVQPIVQAFLHFLPKSCYASWVVCYSIVMKVTYKYLVHSGYDIFQFPYPHSFYLPVYFLAFLCELLLAGFPLHPELPVPTFGTVVCKSEECKGLRFPLSFSPPVFLRKSPEFYQTALLFLQTQSKVLPSAF